MQELKQNSQAALVCLLLGLVTLVVYWPATGFEFTNYDDSEYITQNKQVLRGLTWQGVHWAFARGHAANWHPLTWLSHMLDVQVFGLRAGRHHLVNVGLHTANTLLLFLALRRLTGANWRSAFVAVLFALHPLHVESVAWVAERKDVLSTFFGLLALWAYVCYAQSKRVGQLSRNERGGSVIQILQDSPSPNRFGISRCGSACYFLSIGLFAFSLMSKPMLVTLPFLLLLLDFWPLERFSWPTRAVEGSPALSSLLLEKLPFFVLTAASSMVTFIVQTKAGAATSFENLPLGTRLVTATMAYFGYLTKTFWPNPLAVFYPYRQDWPVGQVLLAAFCLLAITAAAIWSVRRRPYFTVGWLWYVGLLVPVIGLVQVGAQAMADRYTYLPLVGIFIGLTWGVSELLAEWRYGKPILALFGFAAVMACIAITPRQLAYWRTTETLCRHALRVTGDNFAAHAALGAYLLDRGKIDAAKIELQETLRMNPQHAVAHYLLGGQFAREHKLDEAREHLENAIRYHPTFLEAYNELADVSISRGQGEAAMAYARQALALDPNSPDAHFSVGAAFLLQGKLQDALPHYQAALEGKPDFPEARLDWGKALFYLGRPEEAEAHLRQAAVLQPEHLEAHRLLAEIYAGQNRVRDQAAEYEQMLRVAPDWPEVLNNLAWLLATDSSTEMRDGARAVTLAERACKATQQTNFWFLSTLAAAYAEAGKLSEAVRTQQKVCELAAAQKSSNSTESFQARLDLFRSGKAYHKTAVK